MEINMKRQRILSHVICIVLLLGTLAATAGWWMPEVAIGAAAGSGTTNVRNYVSNNVFPTNASSTGYMYLTAPAYKVSAITLSSKESSANTTVQQLAETFMLKQTGGTTEAYYRQETSATVQTWDRIQMDDGDFYERLGFYGWVNPNDGGNKQLITWVGYQINDGDIVWTKGTTEVHKYDAKNETTMTTAISDEGVSSVYTMARRYTIWIPTDKFEANRENRLWLYAKDDSGYVYNLTTKWSGTWGDGVSGIKMGRGKTGSSTDQTINVYTHQTENGQKFTSDPTNLRTVDGTPYYTAGEQKVAYPDGSSYYYLSSATVTSEFKHAEPVCDASGWTHTFTATFSSSTLHNTPTVTVTQNGTSQTLSPSSSSGGTYTYSVTLPRAASNGITAQLMLDGAVYDTIGWSPHVYTVTLDLQGGTGGTTTLYERYTDQFASDSAGGTKITAVTVPTRAGYTFAGYYTGANGTGTQYITDAGVITADAALFTENTTLYALWTANTYRVIYDVMGGTAVTEGSFVYDVGLSSLPVTTKTGYDFAGWYANGTKMGSIPASTYADDVTLTATWTAIVYNITFDSDGGDAVAEMTYTIETNSAALPTPTREGYTFLYWTVTPDAGGTGTWDASYAAGATIGAGHTGHITLVAIWQTNGCAVTYVVVDPSGGTLSITSEIVTADASRTTGSLPTPAAGYHLVGWFTDADCTTAVTAAWVDADGRLKPVFEAGDAAAATYYVLFAHTMQTVVISPVLSDGGSFTDGQTFIYTVSITPTAADLTEVTLTVTVSGGERVYMDLPEGSWTVTDADGWNWRYTKTDDDETTTDGDEGQTLTVVTVTYTRTNDRWLNHGHTVVKTLPKGKNGGEGD